MPTQAQLFGDPNRCSIPISNSYDSCGTITRANIAYATPEGLLVIFKGTDSLGGSSVTQYRDMQSLMTTNLELKACGTKTYGLYDWLMSSARPVGALVNQKKIQGTDSIMEPFVLAAQKSIINSDFWAVPHGFTNANYTTHASTTGVDGRPVDKTSTTYGAVTQILRLRSRDSLDPNTAWFVPGATLHVFSRKNTGVASRTQYIIAAAANEIPASGAVATFTDVALVNVSNGDTSSDTNSFIGIATIGANNVSDYESWCNNRPALNPNKVVPFWIQTSRYTLCVDEFYKEWFAKMTSNNPYFAKFGDVTLAERNRQLGSMWQREWMNSFFWGKRFSANQSLANWTSLPTQYAHYSSNLTGPVSGYDSNTSTNTTQVGRKANAIGVYEQLASCGRVKDLKGQRLNLAELFNELYLLYRARSSGGRPADSMDVYTDSRTAANIQVAMVKYYDVNTQGKTGGTMRMNWDVKDGKIDKLGFRVRSYELLYPQGVTLNVITDNYFDDFLSAVKAEEVAVLGSDHESGQGIDRKIGDSGRFLMFLDLGGGIYPGIVNSNRKVHTVGALQDLAKIDDGYSCVMNTPTKEITLNSVTWTAIVECPDDNLIVENFDDDVPDVVVSAAEYTVLGTTVDPGTETDIISPTSDDPASD